MAVSSSFDLTTPLIAPIADAPQIENPVATSSGWCPGSRNSRPSQNVPANVTSTMATVVSDGHPAEPGDVAQAQLEAEQDDADPHQAFGARRTARARARR